VLLNSSFCSLYSTSKVHVHIRTQLQKHSTQNSWYRIESTVHGHHVYKSSWSPYIGEELPRCHHVTFAGYSNFICRHFHTKDRSFLSRNMVHEVRPQDNYITYDNNIASYNYVITLQDFNMILRQTFVWSVYGMQYG